MEPAAATYLSQFPQQIFSKGSYIARQGEAVEYILKNQGLWETVVADYAREAHAHGQ